MKPKGEGQAPKPFAAATGSGRCLDCEHWEPRSPDGNGPRRWVAPIGHCIVFCKDTAPEHGAACTAHSQNDRTHRREAAAGDVEMQTRAESAASRSVQ